MIAFPFIYFIFLALYLIRQNKGIDISAFLALVYALSAGCSILIEIFDVYNLNGVCEKMDISALATFMYCLLLTLTIIPFRHIHSREIKKINLQKEWLVDFFSFILIITFFTTLFSTYTNINLVLQSDLKEVRDDAYGDSESVKVTGLQWLLQLPETLFSQYAPIAILLFFINTAYERRSTIFNMLLFLSSLTPVIKAILIAGRTQPIYWFLSFCSLYILCRPIFNKAQRRKVLLPFISIGGIIAVFISAVTIARFSFGNSAGDNDTFNSVIAYSGQSFVNFNYFFCKYTAHDIHFDRILPLTNYFIIHPGWDLNEYRDIIWSASGMNIGIFYTFLGDLLVDLGHIGMVIFVFIFTIISHLICKSSNKNGNIKLSKLWIVIILYLIPLHGIFYYSYYKVNVGYFVIGSLIICWILNHAIKYNHAH